jgi:DNA modification methylase
VSLYYEDDYVTLYHGSCVGDDAEPWWTAQVLVTDPPYGMGYESNINRNKKNLKVGRPVAGDHNLDARNAALAIWGPTRPALVFGTWRAEKPVGTKLTLTWDKGVSPGMGDLTLPWGLSTEEVYVMGTWPAIKPGGRASLGGKPSRGPSVLRVDTLNSAAKDRPNHPTPKPVPLMEMLIAKCPPGTIADPFAGSGSTLVAAKALGRKVIGVELEEKYCEIIAKRCAQDLLELEWTA